MTPSPVALTSNNTDRKDRTALRPAAAYCRISDDKVGAGLGVERQLDDIKAYAKSLGLTITNLYTDNDVSAYSGKHRPGYRQLLDDVRDGEVETVIAWHPDRLHRSPSELEEYIKVVEVHGNATHFVKAGTWALDTAAGRMTARIVGAVARQESEHKAERITAAHKQAAHRGIWRGGVTGGPFGYLADAVTIDPGPAAMIRDAFDSILDGKSLGSIVAEWNESGVLSQNGKEWNHATLKQVILRPRNYGASVYKGEVVKENAWPAIVDEDLYRSVAAILASPLRRTSTNTKGRWLLAGLAKCGVCEAEGKSAVVRSASSTGREGKKYPIYKCETKKHLGRRIAMCDEVVTVALLAYVAVNREKILAPRASASTATATEKQERERRGVEAQIAQASALWAQGDLPDAVFQATLATLNARLTAVPAPKVDPAMPELLVALASTEDMREVWESATWTSRRLAVQHIMTVTVLPRRLSAEFLRIDPIG